MSSDSDIDRYLEGQRRNLEQNRRLPHFKFIERINDLYHVSIGMVPRSAPLYFGRLLLVCHSGLLSALTTIGRGLPSDAGGITRRAIEAACLARAAKHDPANLERWLAFEERMGRWEARRQGGRPKRLKAAIADPPGHKDVEALRAKVGVLSDASVHFTPEFFTLLDWRIDIPDTVAADVSVRMRYFEPEQREIERALVDLAGDHIKILHMFDECFDGAFHAQPRWMTLRQNVQKIGHQLWKASHAGEAK